MKTKKAVIVIVALVAIVAGLLFVFTNPRTAAISTTTGTSTSTSATDGKKLAKDTPYFDWQFNSAGEDVALGAPKTQVNLSSNGHIYDLGTYIGSCSKIVDGKTGTLTTGEIEGVVCWFAGGGDEIGIFKEGSNFVVKKREVGEGDPETVAVPTAFKILVQLQEM